jgi:hypothetical protein
MIVYQIKAQRVWITGRAANIRRLTGPQAVFGLIELTTSKSPVTFEFTLPICTNNLLQRR